MSYIVQSEGENTFCFIFQQSIIVISGGSSTDLGCYFVYISNSLCTVWLLLCWSEGHIVLVCDPRKKAAQPRVDYGVLTELFKGRACEGKECTTFQKTVNSQRGESAVFILNHER